jgi:uncharacterized protein (UPF0332 family)
MQIEKAQESLHAAELCFADRLYNSTANRAYYAMFQAAIVALESNGIRARGQQWSHEGVQAMFSLELTRRRKIYPRSMARDLIDIQAIRNQADYKDRNIGVNQAKDTLDAARYFVATVTEATNNE